MGKRHEKDKYIGGYFRYREKGWVLHDGPDWFVYQHVTGISDGGVLIGVQIMKTANSVISFTEGRIFILGSRITRDEYEQAFDKLLRGANALRGYD